MGWATFWAIFSQTHLVTLLVNTNKTTGARSWTATVNNNTEADIVITIFGDFDKFPAKIFTIFLKTNVKVAFLH
jgi:hypothetical protein